MGDTVKIFVKNRPKNIVKAGIVVSTIQTWYNRTTYIFLNPPRQNPIGLPPGGGAGQLDFARGVDRLKKDRFKLKYVYTNNITMWNT